MHALKHADKPKRQKILPFPKNLPVILEIGRGIAIFVSHKPAVLLDMLMRICCQTAQYDFQNSDYQPFCRNIHL